MPDGRGFFRSVPWFFFATVPAGWFFLHQFHGRPAAHGGSFSFSTQIDRQKVLKPKVADAKAPVPELFFTNWWALLAANKPTGLVQRFLFSFGARLNMGKQFWNGFLRDATQPLLENLFAAVVRRFGPHMATLTQPVLPSQKTTADANNPPCRSQKPFPSCKKP